MLPLLIVYFALRFFYLPSLGLELGALGEFPLKRIGNDSYETSRGARLTVKSQEVVGEAEARALVADSKVMIEGLYGRRVNPYRGMISRETVCSLKEALPVLEQEEGSYGIKVTYQLMANESYVYGVCDPKDFAFKSFFVILYCRAEGKLFRIKYFGDKNSGATEVASLAKGVRCAN